MFRLLSLAALCCLISACATTGFDSSLENPDWEIAGKIGARENALRSTSSMFQWRQKDDRYVIYLFNTLGQVQLTLSGNARKTMAQQPDGKTYQADSPEQLLMELTGWYFPVSSARFWLQGQTQGHEENIVRSPEGFITGFQTRQWNVSLASYQAVDGVFLPHRLKLDQDKLHITLVIKDHARFTP